MYKLIKYQKLSITFYTIIISLTCSFHITLPQASSINNCILDQDIQLSPADNSDYCDASNWGGFISNSCCTSLFENYLYALGRRANLTGELFLNHSQQENCFEEDISSCEFQNTLTSGTGGCSDYTVVEIVNKLGDRFKDLDEDCGHLGSDGRSLDQSCDGCLRRWEEIDGSSDLCKFGVLVTLIRRRIDDEKWVKAVFKCLGRQPPTIGKL